MKTTSFRTRALACALLATTAFCGLHGAPAAAQAAPPTFRNLDSNGVDLVQGDFVRAFAEGSIGSGEAELALMRMIGNVGPRSGSQWDNVYMSVAGGQSLVVFGARQDRFPGAEARGSTLSGSGSSYVYRAPDGTQIAFGTGGAETGEISNLCLDGAQQSSCNLIPTSITSPDGKTVTLDYEFWNNCLQQQVPEDPLDCTSYWRLSRVSNSFGYSIAFSYSGTAGSGHVNPSAAFYERTGAAFHNSSAGSSPLAGVSYSYPSGGVTEITDQGGRVWRVTSAGSVYAIRRPGASSDTTSATRSPSDGLVTQVVEEGVTTTYSRSVNTATNVATMTVTQEDPDGPDPATTIISDLTIGRPTSVTDPLGRTTSFQYDADGRLTRVTRPEGNYVQYTYDARGNVTETRLRDKAGNPANDIVAGADYPDDCSNPLTCNSPESTTDARGNATEYTYDPDHGGVLTATGPAPTPGAARPQTRYTYNLANGEYRVTGVSQCRTTSACANGSDEVKTTIAYDSSGNVTSTSTGSGDGALVATTAMTYDALGNLLTVDGPLDGPADTGRIRYNAARQVVGTVSPDPDGAGPLKPRAVRNSYTNGLLTKVEQGNVDSQSDADWAAFASAREVQTDYDANARPVKRKLVAGGTIYALTQTSYDDFGRPLCTAQRMNFMNFATITTDACSLGDQGIGSGDYGPDRIVKTHYDLAGQVTRIETALGTADAANEVTTTYTGNGLVETLTDAESNKTTYVYDGHDRLSQTRYPSATQGAGTSNGSDLEQIGYDAAGNVTSFRNRANETIGFTFDALNRMTAKDLPGSELDVTYGYDLLGQMTSASQTGDSLTFTYDALGRQLSQSGASGVYSSQYDAAGRLTRLTHPDGFFVTQEYLVTGEMTKIRENGSFVLAAFDYDQLGRRERLTLGNGAVTTYQYDPAGRLWKLGHDIGGTDATYDNLVTLTYNPASQITGRAATNLAYSWTGHGDGSTTSDVDGLNRLTWQTTGQTVTAFTHDARGNRLDDGLRTYTYDSENRARGVATSPWHYDPLGRLSGAGNSPGTTPAIAYENYVDRLVAERTPGSSTVQRRHVFGPGTDEPLVWYEGSSRRFLQADERGSIVEVTGDSGGLLAINRYDEYGRTETTSSTYMGRFGYTGQRYFSGFGLYHYKNRVYDPRTGRFMQADPIGYGAGMNLYAYVGADPVNWTDPLGLCGADEVAVARPRTSRPEGDVVALYRFICMRLHNTEGASSPGHVGGGRGGGGGDGIASDPFPDPRRDACGNVLPPASRRYSVPPGYKANPADPKHQTVIDAHGRNVMNPYYATARLGGGIDWEGVAWDLGEIAASVLLSQALGVTMRFSFGPTRGPQIQAANRVDASAEGAARSPGGKCSR